MDARHHLSRPLGVTAGTCQPGHGVKPQQFSALAACVPLSASTHSYLRSRPRERQEPQQQPRRRLQAPTSNGLRVRGGSRVAWREIPNFAIWWLMACEPPPGHPVHAPRHCVPAIQYGPHPGRRHAWTRRPAGVRAAGTQLVVQVARRHHTALCCQATTFRSQAGTSSFSDNQSCRGAHGKRGAGNAPWRRALRREGARVWHWPGVAPTTACSGERQRRSWLSCGGPCCHSKVSRHAPRGNMIAVWG